jgi:hypothetical protein
MKLWMLLLIIVLAVSLEAWSNGSGNAFTNQPNECDNPPYSVHDWIADQARALLPDEERAWLDPHRTMYLLGTEAPDNNDIPELCGAPNTGYGDWSYDHNTDTTASWAASRAQEEYDNAVDAFADGDPAAAAYFLGAMAHYVGNMSQYGYAHTNEMYRADYVRWSEGRAVNLSATMFKSYIKAGDLVRRRPYTAVQRISQAASEGQGNILTAEGMDALYPEKTAEWYDSIGASLNLAVNELASVLHRFYLNEVSQ